MHGSQLPSHGTGGVRACGTRLGRVRRRWRKVGLCHLHHFRDQLPYASLISRSSLLAGLMRLSTHFVPVPSLTATTNKLAEDIQRSAITLWYAPVYETTVGLEVGRVHAARSHLVRSSLPCLRSPTNPL